MMPKWIEEAEREVKHNTLAITGCHCPTCHVYYPKLLKALEIAWEALSRQVEHEYYEPSATKNAKDAMRRIKEMGDNKPLEDKEKV